ncbi:MAG: M28 family peptidase [Planctomyces sp.]|nr:M28 family peptidase [Planctomyces sp.]
MLPRTVAAAPSYRNPRLLLLLPLLALALSTPLSGEERGGSTAARLQLDLGILASDDFEGRGIGTQGLDLAAEFIAEHFAKSGLQPAGTGGDAFQPFQALDRTELAEPNRLALIGPEAGLRIDVAHGSSFQTCSFGGSGSIVAPIVFVGYGIDSQTPAFDEFADVDVQGKVVLILRRVPQQDRQDGLFSDPHTGGGRAAELRTKISNASRRGAAAVLLVNDGYTGQSSSEQLKAQLQKAEQDVLEAARALPAVGETPPGDVLQLLAEKSAHLRRIQALIAADDPDPLIEFGYGGPTREDAIPVIHIRRSVADLLLKAATGESLASLERTIDETGKPASRLLDGWTADVETAVHAKMVDIRNVLGVIEGSGPLADETVVIGAHYDHLGFGGDGSLAAGVHEVHNGADDNASGTTALLELARRFGGRNGESRRRLLFIAFTGEERGLLGSAAYVNSPQLPLESTVAMINLDMVGRLTDDALTVFGAETAPQWNDWLDEPAAKQSLKLVKKPEGFGPSDHSSFYAKRIPVLHLFTGVHSDYHRPTDTAEKINYEGLERIIAFTEEIIERTATSPDRPTYAEVAGRAELARSGSRPYFGSIPDYSSTKKGYVLQGVSPGGPAEQAGIQAGDVLIKLGDQAIADVNDFDLALRRFSAGQEVDVVVLRGEEEVALKVTLGRPRG